MTQVNADQNLSLIVAPGRPSVNADQNLALIVAPGSPSVNADQNLALIVEQRLLPPTITNRVDQLLALIVLQRNFALIQLVGGGYQDFLGNPLAGGYLIMNISNPNEVYTIGNEVVEGCDIHFKITLDSNGNCVSSPAQYGFSTDLLTPACQYIVKAYAADGTTATAPQRITVPKTNLTYDLGLVVPLSPAF